MSFESLGLCEPLLRALRHEGYERPTPIQLQAIPLVLKGADVLACAQTGTGKTAGFALPLLQQLTQKTPVKRKQVRILILTPTRELADQVHESVATYGKYLKMRSAVVFGGVKSVPQVVQLRGGVEILVATPGRLLDLHQQHAFSFESLETLVLDEADRMLDMGFLPDIQRILKLLPSLRQNLLFSATLSPEIRQLAKAFLKNPVEISVTPRQIEAETVQQKVYVIDKSRKAELLAYLIQRENWSQVLVFSRTKYGADKLVKHLSRQKIYATAIHSNKSQAQRTKALENFKQGRVPILIATDIASRGLDIEQLPFVVNFDLPAVPEDYVHRIGRTGRAGSCGQAISFVSAEEAKQLYNIERLLKRTLTRESLEAFKPVQALPTPPKTQQMVNPSSPPSRKKHPKTTSSSQRPQRQASASPKNNTLPSKKAQHPTTRSSSLVPFTSKNNNNDASSSQKTKNPHSRPDENSFKNRKKTNSSRPVSSKKVSSS